MFNFLKGKFQRWTASEQRNELVYFNDMLRGANTETRAMVVAAAAHIKNTYLISDEFLDSKSKSMDGVLLVKAYQHLQKQNLHAVATGVSVWIHTNRAHYELSNRFLVQEMWDMLKISFPYVEETAYNVNITIGINFNIFKFDQIPDEYDWVVLK